MQDTKLTVLKNTTELRRWRKSLDAKAKVGFVPTMGALHAGHAELLKQARQNNDIVLLSIFVNPTQFGPNEDLAKYPRTLESDLNLASNQKVDAVFFPSESEMYPKGYSTFVTEEELSKPLCGQFRPAHFRGVTTVVLKLFNLVQPHHAYFGLKDAQQFIVLRKMVADLNLDLEMVGVSTVREADGLAMSSRNRYLTAVEREKAPLLFKLLKETQIQIADQASVVPVLEAAKQKLSDRGFTVQYFEYLENERLLAAAVFLGKTRLIDNLFL